MALVAAFECVAGVWCEWGLVDGGLTSDVDVGSGWGVQ